MTNPTEMLGKLREADPVPDTDRVHGDDAAAALFSTILRRRDEMVSTRRLTEKMKPQRPDAQPRRWALILGSTAAVVILAIGVPLLLLQGGDTTPGEGPVGTERMTATSGIEPAPDTTTPTVPSTTAAPPTTMPAPLADAGSWTRVPDLAVFDGSLLADIAAGGPGFVALGMEPELWTPRVWISVDGLVWTLVPDDTGVFAEQMDSMLLVTHAGALVVLGNGFLYDGSLSTPAVWISPDGSSWNRVPSEVAGFRSGDRITAVTTGGPGLVAIGEDAINRAVWTSPDGLSWTRVEDGSGVFDGFHDLTAGGPGLVAVGVVDGDGNDAAVWTSVDGTAWRRVTDDASFGGPGNQWMDAVVSGPHGLVAVGSSYTEEGGARGAVWTSTDGLGWTRVPNDDMVFAAIFGDTGESTMNLFDVAAGGPGYVAVGQESAEDRSVILVSSDGLTWTRLAQSEVDIWVESIIVEAGPESVLVAGTIVRGVGEQDPRTGIWMWAP